MDEMYDVLLVNKPESLSKLLRYKNNKIFHNVL